MFSLVLQKESDMRRSRKLYRREVLRHNAHRSALKVEGGAYPTFLIIPDKYILHPCPASWCAMMLLRYGKKEFFISLQADARNRKFEWIRKIGQTYSANTWPCMIWTSAGSGSTHTLMQRLSLHACLRSLESWKAKSQDGTLQDRFRLILHKLRPY